jgi:L-rhamnose mutarotase
MFSIFLSMGLKPSSIDAYKKAHENLWPEIAKSMADNEVSMAIYLENGRLYIFATAPTEAHWTRSRQEPALERWDAAMTEFLETSAPGKIAFRSPEKVFGFGQFEENVLNF